MSEFLETTGILVLIILAAFLLYLVVLGLYFHRELVLCKKEYNVNVCHMEAVPTEVVGE